MVTNLEHDKKKQRNHDNLFKNLVTKYFKEYLEFADEKLYKDLDFSDGYTLISESVSDIQMFKGDGHDHTVDSLIQTKTKSGEKIIIHIEYQSYKQKKFPKRMRKYHLLIADKYDCEVISHAICFLKDQSTLPYELKTHTSTSSKSNLHFIYDKIELYSYNIYEYKNTTNPFILACMGLMKGINTEEKFAYANLKFDSYLNLKELKLDERENYLVAAFFEVYIPLNTTEEQAYFIAKIKAHEEKIKGLEAWSMSVAKENMWSKQIELETNKKNIKRFIKMIQRMKTVSPAELEAMLSDEHLAQETEIDVQIVREAKEELKSEDTH